MRRAATDSDWIIRTEPGTHAERVRNALTADPGVYRYETPPDPSQPFARLIDAVCEPPSDIESVVRDSAGRCLAHTPGLEDDGGRVFWMLTAVGKVRIAQEAVANDADAIRAAALYENHRAVGS